MSVLSRTIRVLMFVAASCLVVNDVARLLFPSIQQVLVQQIFDDTQDDNNPTSAFSFFEEEVKHTSGKERIYHLILPGGELETAAEHLIKDDKVRHLAYVPIFSPPPNLLA